tara:strand:- start:1102 stop:1782 length:681 start_codon:yes stop_codon:yes gene_type:complete
LKKLGILGVAPWATFDFLEIFYKKFNAKKDWEYPRILVDINTEIPSRGRYFDLKEENPSCHIKNAIQRLIDQDAYCCVVICNTAHILFDQWGAEFDDRVINLLNEVGKQINKANSYKFSVIGSSYLNTFKTYQNYTTSAYVPLFQDEQNVVSEMINMVKTGKLVENDNIYRIEKIIDRLRRDEVDMFVIGCTELSFLARLFNDCGIRFLDSNAVLAESLKIALYKN